MIGLLNVILGAGLLLAGRRIFWFLVGTIGFLIGVEVASRLAFRSQLYIVIAALLIGAVFAMLAIYLESVAIGLAGFLGGGFAAVGIANAVGLSGPPTFWIAFVVGGIVGVMLTVALFTWALITISSLAGASMVVTGLALRPGLHGLVYVLLVLGGVIIQGLTLREEQARAKRSA
jgi:hypothetical protein